MSVLGFVLSFALGVCVIAGGYLFKLKQDNIIEQMVEDVIEQETGLDIDLSPEELDQIKKL